MANPQKENGYTAIANEILEKIIGSGLNGTELAVVLYVWRKTYGYQKTTDEISLSQFMEVIPVSRQTLCSALTVLQLVNILRLVSRGTSRKHSNRWEFNKNYDKWELVKKMELVKVSKRTSQENLTELVKFSRPTKERKKDTKENPLEKELINQLSILFEYTAKYNPTSYSAIRKLLKRFKDKETVIRFAKATKTFDDTGYGYVIESPNSLYKKSDAILARLKKNRPTMTYDGMPVREVNGKYQIQGTDGEWREFGGDRSKIIKNK